MPLHQRRSGNDRRRRFAACMLPQLCTGECLIGIRGTPVQLCVSLDDFAQVVALLGSSLLLNASTTECCLSCFFFPAIELFFFSPFRLPINGEAHHLPPHKNSKRNETWSKAGLWRSLCGVQETQGASYKL